MVFPRDWYWGQNCSSLTSIDDWDDRVEHTLNKWQTAPKWEEQSACWRTGLPWKGMFVTKRNLMKLTKNKCSVLHPGCENIAQSCNWDTDWVEKRFAEGNLTYKRLSWSQELTYGMKMCCVALARAWRAAVGGLPSTPEAASGAAGVVLFCSFYFLQLFPVVLSNLC